MHRTRQRRSCCTAQPGIGLPLRPRASSRWATRTSPRSPEASSSGRPRVVPGRPPSRSHPISGSDTIATFPFPRLGFTASNASSSRVSSSLAREVWAHRLPPTCAAAGVGALGLVDGDIVDPSNLQRQVLHSLDTIGWLKVDSARARLERINPDVKIETHGVRLTAANALEIMGGYDLVVDGADNFPTRYLINDASLHLRVPVVHGSILRFEGRGCGLRSVPGPLLPLPPPRAATLGACPIVRRGRCSWSPSGGHRVDPVGRGVEAPARRRFAPRGPAPHL